MPETPLTPAEIAMIDATVDRVHAERADAGIMGARYDAACERIVELLDETAAQRRRIAELEAERPPAAPRRCPWTRTVPDGTEARCLRAAGHDGAHWDAHARPHRTEREAALDLARAADRMRDHWAESSHERRTDLWSALHTASDALREIIDAGPTVTPETHRAADLEERLAGAVTVHPDYRAGQACIGGTRVSAWIIAGLVPDVGEDDIGHYYPSVTPAGAKAAVRFSEQYVEREEVDRLQALARVRGKWAAHRRKRIRALVAENTDLRAQLFATTRPHRAADRLADDARPTGGGQ